MTSGRCAAHMASMTQTNHPGPRIFEASIASVFEFLGRRTIAMKRGTNWVSNAVPLTDVTITLAEGEVFMASNGKGETRYFTDFNDAWQSSHSLGSVGAPDAIVILSPTVGPNGIVDLITVRLHERAVVAVAEARS